MRFHLFGIKKNLLLSKRIRMSKRVRLRSWHEKIIAVAYITTCERVNQLNCEFINCDKKESQFSLEYNNISTINIVLFDYTDTNISMRLGNINWITLKWNTPHSSLLTIFCCNYSSTGVCVRIIIIIIIQNKSFFFHSVLIFSF